MTQPAPQPCGGQPPAPPTPRQDRAAGAAGIRSLVQSGDLAAAAAAAGQLIEASFGLPVSSVELTVDEYSLNSVSGRVRFADGHVEFFKFHQEEGEEQGVPEYYRARLLAEAGLPVDVPERVATEPGRQIALYRLRTEPRMADVCADLERADLERADLERADLERAGGAAAGLGPGLAAARRSLDATIGTVMLATLGPPVASSASAAIHQLFHHRLTGGTGAFPGGSAGSRGTTPCTPDATPRPRGRYAAWYLADPAFGELAGRRFRLNGVTYARTPHQLVTQAAELLEPAALAALPVVTAHGDDHQGNVWVIDTRAGTELRLFDAAFAADDIPALLAPVKATYHNVFAHPFWLYHPDEAARRIGVKVHDDGDVLSVDFGVPISLLRREILDSIAELIWAPLLAALAARGDLPPDWRAIVRAALLCCPLLVTNLLSPARPAPLRLLGLAQVVLAGSEPTDGADPLSRMLDAVTPA